jgi:murein DD-endopeptidase MepM/ murein hydrolase activator NlpD
MNMHKKFLVESYKIAGYDFGELTWYSAWHLGVDLRSSIGDKMFAVWDGELLGVSWGNQGGNWVFFLDDMGYLHRFGHCDHATKDIQPGRKERGEVFAIAGNTGELTTNPHIHWDVLPNCGHIKTLSEAVSYHAQERRKAKSEHGLLATFIDPKNYKKMIEGLDKQTTSKWAEEAVQWNKSNGIMVDNSKPQDNVTREEQAVMNQRIYNLIMEEVKKLV